MTNGCENGKKWKRRVFCASLPILENHLNGGKVSFQRRFFGLDFWVHYINRWVKLGLIAPTKVYKQILYFDQAAIDKFFANNITCEEAAKIMGVGKLTMHWWIRGGWLSKLCISGPDLDGYHSYLLDKSRLIRWREEHLTFAEAASLLDIPYVTLQQWCKKGKLVPRESIGKKYLWFSKQEVMQIKSSMTNPLGNIPSREDE